MIMQGNAKDASQAVHLKNSQRAIKGICKQLSDMPKPFSDALESCLKLPARYATAKLPARYATAKLPARLTLGLAELPEDLVRWAIVAESKRADKHPQKLTEQHQPLYSTDLHCFSRARSLGNILCWDQPLLVLTRMETLQGKSIIWRRTALGCSAVT